LLGIEQRVLDLTPYRRQFDDVRMMIMPALSKNT